MEPRQIGHEINVENALTPESGSHEFGLPQNLPDLDNAARFENAVEKQQDDRVEQDNQPPVALPTIPLDDAAASDSSAAQPQLSDDTPLVAGDNDLIEKEWIDKAKKIIEETRDDPYTRERSINKLQIEYIKKRYGRELGNTGE